MRSVAVLTVGRSDYGMYRPVLRQMQDDPDLDLQVIVTGMHLSPEFGLTVRSIEQDQFPIAERVESLLSSSTPEGVAKSMGLGTISLAQSFARRRPDILVVLGDRFEMHAAAVAAVPFKIPIAHIAGGELTMGAMDDALRHSLTKLSHLHFVTTPEHARRVVQLGEEPWRIVVSGLPSLDDIRRSGPMSRQELEAQIGTSLPESFLLVTFHPVTLEFEQTEWQITELLAALHASEFDALFTMPNADMENSVIRRGIREYAATHPGSVVVEELGTPAYFAVMAAARAMVGNSSSGVLEAPSFGLPVVNVGTRQDGRARAANVIDAPYDRDSITEAIARVTSASFRRDLEGMVNPYDAGGAARIITERLRNVELGDALLFKRFQDIPSVEAA